MEELTQLLLDFSTNTFEQLFNIVDCEEISGEEIIENVEICTAGGAGGEGVPSQDIEFDLNMEDEALQVVGLSNTRVAAQYLLVFLMDNLHQHVCDVASEKDHLFNEVKSFLCAHVGP